MQKAHTSESLFSIKSNQEQIFKQPQVCKLSEKVDNKVEVTVEKFKEYAHIGKKKNEFSRENVM